MAFTENLDGFFLDFGVTAVVGAESAQVLFETPETIIADARVITAEYEITYKSMAFTSLTNGSTITVDGNNYIVNSTIAIEDGKLKRATLSSA